ncbi:unnamed protein product [Arabis nemorensis]|uniref:Uncharacterized protein n=1 Tax=Arabis nemorensis TaxID=586526 RepID=A0A565B257_9BRAS|nr:unnamed protein product [Arabis nemorensis]
MFVKTSLGSSEELLVSVAKRLIVLDGSHNLRERLFILLLSKRIRHGFKELHSLMGMSFHSCCFLLDDISLVIISSLGKQNPAVSSLIDVAVGGQVLVRPLVFAGPAFQQSLLFLCCLRFLENMLQFEAMSLPFLLSSTMQSSFYSSRDVLSMGEFCFPCGYRALQFILPWFALVQQVQSQEAVFNSKHMEPSRIPLNYSEA